MVTLPLGKNAYSRRFAAEPEVRLINRFAEKNPANLREQLALLSRPGTVTLAAFTNALIRGTFSKPGFFGGDLFISAGAALYRYSKANGITNISGLLNGTGYTPVTWTKGAGYTRLFISDGLLLQYYAGGTQATGTLTLSGGSITTQVINIGGVYYTWGSNVNAGTPAGTASAPWIAKLGATNTLSLAAMVNLLAFNGVRGIDFSTALGGPSTLVTATSTATTLVATAISDMAAGNNVTTSVYSGSFLAWGSATLTGGGTHALQGVAMPDGNAPLALTSVSGYVLVSVANSQRFFWVQPGEVIINGLDFASKESNPDNVVDMITVGDTVILTGDGSTENWYATGNNAAPFAPIEGRVYMRGSIAGTPTLVKDSLVLVGDDGIVYEIGYNFGTTAQYGVHRISTHGIEERIRTQLRREQGLS